MAAYAGSFLYCSSWHPVVACLLPFKSRGLLDTRLNAAANTEKGKTLRRDAGKGSKVGELAEARKRNSIIDYLDEFKDFVSQTNDEAGPPRWFSPLVSGPQQVDDAPLLLYLPGIDGIGLGLIKHHKSLGKFFQMWCLHIPVMDRTSFEGLMQLIEKVVEAETSSIPNRPIYIVGECLGACLALSVAARNPNVDLILILANPATSYERSPLQILSTVLQDLKYPLQLTAPYVLSLIAGADPLKMFGTVVNNLVLEHSAVLSQDSLMSSHLLMFSAVFPGKTLLWKLNLMQSAAAYANSRLHTVSAQTLILSSDEDRLLPSTQEAMKLELSLAKCERRNFSDSGHFLFLEDCMDLMTIIKNTSFYRRRKYQDFVSDYIQPTPSEFANIAEASKWLLHATDSVMLSTVEDGMIVKGLDGIPSEGPVIYVGYHMLLGMELVPLVGHLFAKRNILLRGIAHPMMFSRSKNSQTVDLSFYDTIRMMGGVPACSSSIYKLLSSKAHVLLFPGGMREACHRKGEEYKLIWPEQPEFVRMAAKFGAKIVPFGSVGEDDFAEVVFDYDDQMNVPFLREFNKELADSIVRLRSVEVSGEVGNQELHLPGLLPKLPGGRVYFYFGKPIETIGKQRELRDGDKAKALYMQVKSEIENCIAFLKEKRRFDPYRSLPTRIMYKATHGIDAEVPTFEL